MIPSSPGTDLTTANLLQSTHPYGVVSTSTALLTRSNSANARVSHHCFSPSSPQRFDYSPSRRHDYRGHLHSKSLSSLSDTPPPLPTPPGTNRQTRHRPAVSGSITDVELSSESGTDVEDVELSNGLNADIFTDRPRDPKLWTTTVLSSYLLSQKMSSLAEFVTTNNVTGREMLRFSPSSVLPPFAETLDPSCVDDLMDQSRKLRLIALKIRIWGLQTASDNDDCSEDSGIMESPTFSASQGKVKGIVEALELGSMNSTPSKKTRWLSGTPLPLNSKAATPKNSKNDSGVHFVKTSTPAGLFLSDSDHASSLVHATSSSASSTSEAYSDLVTRDVEIEQQDSPTTFFTGPDTEEPSIENLLQLEPENNQITGSWGAEAWEIELAPGETARRVAHVVPTTTKEPSHSCSRDVKQLFSLVDEEVLAQKSIVLETEPRNTQDSEPTVFSASAIDEPDTTIISNYGTEDGAPPPTMASNVQPESFDALKARIAMLESKVAELERQPQPDENPQVPNDAQEIEIPQYLLMAGVGACAVIGQALLRKVFGKI